MTPRKLTNSEYVDMLLVYGEMGQNFKSARERYVELYPERHPPSVKMFKSLVHRARETGSLQVFSAGRGCDRFMRSLQREQAISEAVQNNPLLSIRQIARSLNLPRSTVHQAVRASGTARGNNPSHCRVLRTLAPDVYPARVEYCQWLVNKYTENVDFPLGILFTDEACFTQGGIFNIHNRHKWTTETNEGSLGINVWIGIMDNSIIGPFVLPNSLTKKNYLNFLENDLQLLLEDVPFNTRQQMWFQHSGATPYFTPSIREYLNSAFEDRWIGRGGPIAWPICSPDLNPVEYFLWSHMKQIVYKTQINNDDELIERIQDAARTIKKQNILENVLESLIERACTCIQAGGSSFEYLL